MFWLIQAFLRFFGIIIVRLERPQAARGLPVFTIPFGIAGKPPGLEPPPPILE
jgi:hypothetical protein